MTRRPALTNERIIALAALAELARPRLKSRVGSNLFGFATTHQANAVRAAVKYIDDLSAWHAARTKNPPVTASRPAGESAPAGDAASLRVLAVQVDGDDAAIRGVLNGLDAALSRDRQPLDVTA